MNVVAGEEGGTVSIEGTGGSNVQSRRSRSQTRTRTRGGGGGGGGGDTCQPNQRIEHEVRKWCRQGSTQAVEERMYLQKTHGVAARIWSGFHGHEFDRASTEQFEEQQ